MSTKHTIVICDECKQEFSMTSVNIQEAIIDLGGQALMLVYFTCPKCNKIYRITLKDKRYEELVEDLMKTKTRMRKIYGSGNDEMARRLNQMAVKKHQRMRHHLSRLNNKFPGTFTFVASENNHKDKIIIYLP